MQAVDSSNSTNISGISSPAALTYRQFLVKSASHARYWHLSVELRLRSLALCGAAPTL
jgi:hypothetical protein